MGEARARNSQLLLPAAASAVECWQPVVACDKDHKFTNWHFTFTYCRPEHVALVFTPAFLRCLATNLKKADSHLHSGAKKCMERIAAYCDKAAPGADSAVLDRAAVLPLSC